MIGQISVKKQKLLTLDFLKNLSTEYQDTKNDSFENTCENIFNKNIYNQINSENKSNLYNEDNINIPYRNKNYLIKNGQKNNHSLNLNRSQKYNSLKHNNVKINTIFENKNVNENIESSFEDKETNFNVIKIKNILGVCSESFQILSTNNKYDFSLFFDKNSIQKNNTVNPSKFKLNAGTQSQKINEIQKQNEKNNEFNTKPNLIDKTYNLKNNSKTNHSMNLNVQNRKLSEPKNIFKSENIVKKDNKIDVKHKKIIPKIFLKNYKTDKLIKISKKIFFDDFWDDKGT